MSNNPRPWQDPSNPHHSVILWSNLPTHKAGVTNREFVLQQTASFGHVNYSQDTINTLIRQVEDQWKVRQLTQSTK